MLTKELLDFYHTNGYLGVENVLSATEVADLQRVTDEFDEKSRAVTAHTAVFDLEPGHTPQAPRLRRLKNPVQQHPVYDQALRHPGILDIVEQLIGPGVRTNGDKLNMKSAGFGSPVEWHQDIVFYPHSNDDLLAVGIAIDDMLMKNGPLLVIPGSHKGPLYSHHQDGVFVGAVTEDVSGADEAVPIELKAGGISIHHANALHASAPNVSDQPRRLLLFQYCAVDAWPLLGISDWTTFNSNILRGEPTNRPRMTAVPVQIPLPQPERAGSIYEIQTQLEKSVFGQAAR